MPCHVRSAVLSYRLHCIFALCVIWLLNILGHCGHSMLPTKLTNHLMRWHWIFNFWNPQKSTLTYNKSSIISLMILDVEKKCVSCTFNAIMWIQSACQKCGLYFRTTFYALLVISQTAGLTCWCCCCWLNSLNPISIKYDDRLGLSITGSAVDESFGYSYFQVQEKYRSARITSVDTCWRRLKTELSNTINVSQSATQLRLCSALALWFPDSSDDTQYTVIWASIGRGRSRKLFWEGHIGLNRRRQRSETLSRGKAEEGVYPLPAYWGFWKRRKLPHRGL